MPIKTRKAALDDTSAAPGHPDDTERRARIAIAAYYRAEQRGFAPGLEIEDWLEAEREYDAGLARGSVETPDAPGVSPAATPPAPRQGKPKALSSRRSRPRKRRNQAAQ